MVLTEKSIEVLMQLRDIIGKLPEGSYDQPLDVLEGNTVGKHARHIVEFFECLLASASSRCVNYDNRNRDALLEKEPRELNGRIAALALVLRTNDFYRDNELTLQTSLDDDQDVLINTSFDRELWYNIEHCTHHLAIIRIAARSLGVTELPEHLGLAYSTRKHLAEETSGERN